jgi:hypothetical protein
MQLRTVEPLCRRDQGTIDTKDIGANISNERKAFMTSQFTGDLNFSAIQNIEIPDQLKLDLQDCLRCDRVMIYREQDIQ